MWPPSHKDGCILATQPPQCKRRNGQRNWHPTQRLADGDDGGCILGVRVAMPLELQYTGRFLADMGATALGLSDLLSQVRAQAGPPPHDGQPT